LISAPETAVRESSGAEREIAATRSAVAWKRKRREILVYALALLVFAAILYLLMRAPTEAGV
jgi:hypothetical protein